MEVALAVEVAGLEVVVATVPSLQTQEPLRHTMLLSAHTTPSQAASTTLHLDPKHKINYYVFGGTCVSRSTDTIGVTSNISHTGSHRRLRPPVIKKKKKSDKLIQIYRFL